MYNTSGTVLAEKPSIGIEPTRLYDASRWKNHGVHTNITMVQLPKGLWVRSFNGSNSIITVPASPSLNNLADVTYMAWVYHNTGYGEVAAFIASKGDAAPLWNFFYVLELTRPGEITFRRDYATADAHAVSTERVVENQWNFLAATCINKVPRIYINALEVSYEQQDTGVGNLEDDSAYDLLIGNDLATGRTLDGFMALFKALNYGLSQGQIKKIYEKQRPWFGV